MGCIGSFGACEIGSVNAPLPDFQNYYEQDGLSFVNLDYPITSGNQSPLDDILVALTPDSYVNKLFGQEVNTVPTERPDADLNVPYKPHSFSGGRFE